jgi:hypothetical protein
MGKSIGSLGTKRGPVDLEFDYFGSTIRVHPQASDTVELEFLDVGRDIDLELLQDKSLEELDDDQRWAVLAEMGRAIRGGYLLVKDSLQQLIHPEDWPTYWKLARENGQQIRDLMSDLKYITAKVVEAETGFPTRLPSGSAGGPVTMPPKSAADSSSDPDKALAVLRGRPDLQEFVVARQESQAEKSAAAQRGGGTAASRLLAEAANHSSN